MQTGEILWRNDELKPVLDSMTQFGDFKSIFGNQSLHCGLITRQEHRLWVNGIGTDYQLVKWDDPQDPMDQGVGTPVLYTAKAAAAAKAARDGSGGGGNNADTEVQGPNMYWECPACTCANFNGDQPDATCEVCATPRFPPPVSSSSSSTAGSASRGGGPTPAVAGSIGFEFLGQVFDRPFDPYADAEHPFAEEAWCVDLIGGALRTLYPPEPEEKKLTCTFF